MKHNLTQAARFLKQPQAPQQPIRTATTRRKTAAILSLLLLLWLVPGLSVPALAQTEETYTVQVGDTLSKVALQYNQTVAALAAYNNLNNPNLILVGQQLRIPLSDDATPVQNTPSANTSYTVQPGDTLFTIAQQLGVRMNRLVEVNNIVNVDVLAVGQVLTIPPEEQLVPIPLRPPFADISFSETLVAQGRTLVLQVELTEPARLSVDLEDRPVLLGGGGASYWGVVGIHALSEVGIYTLTFRAVLDDGTEAMLAQNVKVVGGPYGAETIVVIPGRESLLQPEVVQAEFARVSEVWNRITPQQYWQGRFRYPVDDTRVTSPFGTRRQYEGGAVSSYHAGTDFGGGVGTPIYAPAPGVVALAEPLSVRGNAVLIDHGLGLFSGYWHLDQILVEPGQNVEPGTLIGLMGNTGLVTGPHLHWEMRLGGIAVSPLQWVQESIP